MKNRAALYFTIIIFSLLAGSFLSYLADDFNVLSVLFRSSAIILLPDDSKGKLIRHGGSMRGYLSNYHKYLDDHLTIILLGNIRPYAVMDITTGIKEIIFGRDPIPRNEMSYRY